MSRPAADSVKVEWSGTGTGTMSLGSAVSGFQAFPAALDGEVVSYSIEHQSNAERENGLGTYTHSGTTLSRDYISFSTNGNALVNFSSGTKHVRLTALVHDFVEHRDTVDPTSSDNIDSGHIAGRSRWLNTAASPPKLFILVDDGSGSSPATAVWQEVGPGGGATELSELSDVDASVSSPSDGDILVYRDAGGDWILEPKPAGGSNPALADITNVTITSVADNELLAYDSGSGDWINQTPAEAGIAAAIAGTGLSALSGQLNRDPIGVGDLAAGAADVLYGRDGDGNGAAITAGSGITISSGSISASGITSVNHTVLEVNEGTTITDAHRKYEVSGAQLIVRRLLLRHSTTLSSAVTVTVSDGVSAGVEFEFLQAADQTGTCTVQRQTNGTIDGGASVVLPASGLSGLLIVDETDGSTPVMRWEGASTQIQKLYAELQAEDNVVSRPELKDYAETSTTPSSSSGTLTLDLENGNYFKVTLTENVTTLTINNPPATAKGGTIYLKLIQDGTGGRTFSWPAAVKWAGGTAPTLSSGASQYDVFTLVTDDAGTTWEGYIGGQNFS